MKRDPHLSARSRPQQATHPGWEQLYGEFGERVFRLLHRMVGDAPLAEDLTHDVFVRIYEKGGYRGEGEVAAWVFRIAGNLGRDELRRQNVRSVQDMPVELPACSAPIDHELRISLEAALAALDEDARTVVLLHDVDGYRHHEIAQMLAIQEGTSRARLSRAHAVLRKVLRDDHREVMQ